MPVVNYHTVNGEVIGETTTGQPRVDYLTDALGSITATVDQSAQVVNTYRYKPFGGLLAKTGPGPDPAFGWCGSHGYRRTGNKFSDFYVRARHYDTATGRWPAGDPFPYYPWKRSYEYVYSSPANYTDPSGLKCDRKRTCCDQLVGPNGSITINPSKPSETHCGGGGKWVPFPWKDKDLVHACDNESCYSMLAMLKDALNYCDSMCNKSQHPIPVGQPASPYNPTDIWDGDTNCCTDSDGTKRACGPYYCNTSPSPLCWLKCTLLHEERHVQQCLGTIPLPGKVPDPDAWWECDAYRKSVDCMFSAALASCEGRIGHELLQRVFHCLKLP